MDLTAEVTRSQLIPLQVATATVTGSGVDLANTLTQDLLVATLQVKAVTGTSPTLDVKLQDSKDNSTFADVAADALMPATAFAQVTATAANPLTLAVDPRGIRRYVRAVATIGGTTPSFTLNLDLLRRPLQVGFGTTSG